MFEGSCLIEKADGSILGIAYHKYDPVADQSYFSKVDTRECGYGYGFGKVSEEKAQEVRARHGFKILKTFKKSFKARINPMLEQQ